MTRALQLAYDYINMIELGYTVEYSEHMRMRKAALNALRAELAKPDTFKPLDTVYRWTALKDGKLVYQYGEDGYPQLFAKTAVKLPEEPEPAQKPLTVEQINNLPSAKSGPWPMSIAKRVVALIREVEAAHGIGGKA